MSVYLIAQLNIHDRATYDKYVSGFMEIFDKYGGRVLAVDEAAKVLEGHWDYARTVLLEVRRAPDRPDAALPPLRQGQPDGQPLLHPLRQPAAVTPPRCG